jgi:putative intracellular protease/amidase
MRPVRGRTSAIRQSSLHGAAVSWQQRSRVPVVAVLAQNSGTEITDFLVPGVIAASGAADVVAVSNADRRWAWPGLMVVATTIERFDRDHPNGADFVIVPAFHDSRNDATRSWLRIQADKGATLVSICDGALALANTGLLDGHRATGHFYSDAQRRRAYPNVDWVTNALRARRQFISPPASARRCRRRRSLNVPARAALRSRGGGCRTTVQGDSDAFHVGAAEY